MIVHALPDTGATDGELGELCQFGASHGGLRSPLSSTSSAHNDGIDPLWCGGAASDNTARGILGPVWRTPNLVMTNIWYVVTRSISALYLLFVPICCLAGAPTRWWRAMPRVGSELYSNA